MRGTFIVLEGLDRSGKSTQVDRLIARLNKEGHQARLQKFPDRTTQIGGMIDAYLQSKAEMDDRAIHLLFAANRWECVAAIERDLAAGIMVVADRYAFSGIAFSAAKGLPFEFCLGPDSGLPAPDISLFLTLTPEVAASRGAYGEERYENLELQTRVRAQFGLVARRFEADGGRWVEIDAGGTMDGVEGGIWGAVGPVVAREKGEVGKLWVGK